VICGEFIFFGRLESHHDGDFQFQNYFVNLLWFTINLWLIAIIQNGWGWVYQEGKSNHLFVLTKATIEGNLLCTLWGKKQRSLFPHSSTVMKIEPYWIGKVSWVKGSKTQSSTPSLESLMDFPHYVIVMDSKMSHLV